MAMGRRAKNRLKMFGLIFCCSSVIAALATSTMAWYAAESSITVDPSSSSVTIRTPFQYHLYAYKGNRFPTGTWTAADKDSAPGSGYNTANPNYALTNENSYEEFNALEYTDADQQTAYQHALTKVEGLWPGYQMSFAIKVVGLDPELDAPVLSLTTISSPSLLRLDTGGNAILLKNAIEVKAGAGDTIGNAYNAATAKNYTGTTDDDIDISWPSLPLVLGELNRSEYGNNTTFWYFYNIKFSNADSTLYTYNTATEKYDQNNDGNSSVYEGMGFELVRMTLENPS
ncbi:MAG: hypothetical protein IJU64_07210 [Bacilli bacterium]|nr:hypothetical protein [Bacilli bacterium]